MCTACSSRSHGALLNGSKMIWLGRSTRSAVDRAAAARRRCSWACRRSTCACWPSRGSTATPARNMRLFISGSAPLLIETFDEWRERTGHTILERYGMSETVMLTSNPYGPRRRAPRRHGRLSAARAWSCACATTRARAAGRRDRRHRGARARTSSRATGACPRRRRRSSPTTAGSRPATSARSTTAAT